MRTACKVSTWMMLSGLICAAVSVALYWWIPSWAIQLGYVSATLWIPGVLTYWMTKDKESKNNDVRV